MATTTYTVLLKRGSHYVSAATRATLVAAIECRVPKTGITTEPFDGHAAYEATIICENVVGFVAHDYAESADEADSKVVHLRPASVSAP